MAIDTVTEFDGHPHLTKKRPGLQQNEVGCLEGNAYQGGSIAQLPFQEKTPIPGQKAAPVIASDAVEERPGAAGVGTCHRFFGVALVAAALCAGGCHSGYSPLCIIGIDGVHVRTFGIWPLSFMP